MSGSDEDLAALSFEELVATLEDLTRRISDSDVGIEESAELYRRAKIVHGLASAKLDEVSKRIEDLAQDPEERQRAERGDGSAP